MPRALFLLLLFAPAAAAQVALEGPLRVWQTLSLTIDGPVAAESDSNPNPFLDYRLQARFGGPSGQSYDIPGYFDGDGQGGERGGVWRVRFTPDEAGVWSYAVSFRRGAEVAASLDPEAGEPLDSDGLRGAFRVSARDSDAPGFARWGRLEYVGKRYLKFRDGPYWLRGGTDSPENLLAYAGFDNTRPSHRYEEHVGDWREGDPDWGDGAGRGVIGALNYLASKRVNSIYFLTMNIGGDGGDVWPWIGEPPPQGAPDDDNLHFDLSKLRQWETVFAHAQRLGIFLHFVLNEAEEENKRELDDGELGVERKLYYRELVARFGHHLALQWNLCEEYNIRLAWTPQQIREFAAYLKAQDPYDHPITVHSARDPREQLAFIFGDPLFGMTSIQLNQRRLDEIVEDFVEMGRNAGRPLPVSTDEFTVDVGQEQSHIPFDRADLHRKQKIWPGYLSGGMIEFILEGLLQVDTFRTPEREALWDYVWYARRFLEENTPFWEMTPADQLIAGAGTIEVGLGRGETFQLGPQALARSGEVYAIYLPSAQPAGRLDLSDAPGRFRVRWYDPRAGLFKGDARTVAGGGAVELGSPPDSPAEDWALLVERF